MTSGFCEALGKYCSVNMLGKMCFLDVVRPCQGENISLTCLFAQNKIPGENPNLLATFNEPQPPPLSTTFACFEVEKLVYSYSQRVLNDF